MHSIEDTIKPNLECPICYTSNNLEKKFKCKHLVCKDCFSNQIKTSMSINLKCPICNNENLGEDVKENELNKLFALHFINCANIILRSSLCILAINNISSLLLISILSGSCCFFDLWIT